MAITKGTGRAKNLSSRGAEVSGPVAVRAAIRGGSNEADSSANEGTAFAVAA